ncbi:Dinuclear metal center protein, YbgI/SA1388 family [Desulfonema limicola]|uniref:GTP cyclohydrolase 1 type 2 homolog n=1 Tax=Desulfonema limicola TaxID=45656 RepID=A0A975GI60_9BACT|nr:Nif3-like dinuclear metal center hexameric protein [Desulfonema limicola]QTA81989.1 Dinuclear metal center protein, YbgI/SA1388 family [Desulfonema limicola]
MSVTIADMAEIMADIAPPCLAEQWDNSGLQVGQMDWPVKNVQIALDPLPEVVGSICREADLLITHHPLIFKPLKTIDLRSPLGSVIDKAVRHKLGIFSAHTNLDSSAHGINDYLAQKIGLRQLRVLGHEYKESLYKLSVYVPVEKEHDVLNALFETPAGTIGNYTCCSFRNYGTGTFRPGKAATPYSGEINAVSQTQEVRIEAQVLKKDIDLVIRYLRKHHPYETMAYDIFPLDTPSPDQNNLHQDKKQGLGRVGILDTPTDLKSFALKIKHLLGIQNLKFAGRPDLAINTAALCSGSGSSLMKQFFSSGAQVYISGDLHYHDARDVESAGLGLIDIGHFASEHLMVDVLANRLKEIITERNMKVQIEAFKHEKDPFVYL